MLSVRKNNCLNAWLFEVKIQIIGQHYVDWPIENYLTVHDVGRIMIEFFFNLMNLKAVKQFV